MQQESEEQCYALLGKCVRGRSQQTHKMIFPSCSVEIPFQPIPLRRTGGTRSTTQAASPLGFSWSHSRHFNTENRKAFVVGLFKPRTSGEEREKRLVSWFRLSEEFSVLHMPHLLLANSVQLGFLLSMPVTRHFEAIFIRFP